jgi:hypothetical protein
MFRPAAFSALALLHGISFGLLLGCGPTGLSAGGTTAATIAVGGGHRAIETVTDLDTVRDLDVSADRVFVATDYGLLLHYPGGGEGVVRVTAAQGLPSNDVRAVVVGEGGRAIVASSGPLVQVDAEGNVTPFADAPPVGKVTAMLLGDDGTLWAGGVAGLARYASGAWARFGEPASITTLVKTPEGGIWVGTMRGLFLVEGEVIREHAIDRGIPEPYVRSIVPVRPGEILALLQGPTDTKLGYWNGERWFSYTVNLDAPAIALARRGNDYLLVTPANAFAITPEVGSGAVRMTPLGASGLRGVRSYGARVLAPDQIDPPAEGREPPEDVARPATPLAMVPDNQPTIEAPPFGIRPVELSVPVDVYWALGKGDDLYLADRNRGVTKLNPSGFGATLRSLDLVGERDLQIAIDASRSTWVMSRDKGIAVYRDGHLERVPAPDGVQVQCLANGPDGAYVLTLVSDQPSTVRLYRVSSDGWTQQMERQLEVSPPLTGVDYFAMTDEREVWAGLRVVNEMGESPRLRGVAVFREEGDIIYHHRNANRDENPGALRMPDEAENIDLGMPGYAWFPSLFGAIRVGNSQAVTFGEARGVRGEVVSDVAVGDGGRVWIAAAEGVGYYEDSNFEFRMPQVVQQSRPTSLALDSQGNLWAAGPNGVAYFDGTNWLRLTEDNGLPTNALVDVEVDGQDHVWMLAEDRVLIFTQTSAQPGR